MRRDPIKAAGDSRCEMVHTNEQDTWGTLQASLKCAFFCHLKHGVSFYFRILNRKLLNCLIVATHYWVVIVYVLQKLQGVHPFSLRTLVRTCKSMSSLLKQRRKKEASALENMTWL